MIRNIYRKYGFYILIAYLIAAFFFPVLGAAAVICMLAPVIFALAGRGRYWCGNFCPRGNFFQNVTCHISKKRPVPKFLKSTAFRAFMVLFIIGNFSFGIYSNWGNLPGIGMVFYRIIVITTLVGVVLSALYLPRTWCTFCPMGSISSFITWIKGKKKSAEYGEKKTAA
ncbi:MAG: 4Fe-4S binding protein [Lachnospiraceae bacterium]|nr:4Fe-4S binding protein [Lachnospiraceae bacterium]